MPSATEILQEKLPLILESARLAPSVHNTQPWLVRASGDSVLISIDPEHKLADGDPTGRQTIISLGIFCEAISLIAADFSLETKKIGLQDQAAVIQMSENTGHAAASPSKTPELLLRRSSDRSIYGPVEIGQPVIKALEKCGSVPGVSVKVVTDKAILQQIAVLTGKGIGLALSSPGFRRELSRYLVLPGSRKKRGIAVRSLYIAWPIALLEPWLLRLGLGLKAEARLEEKRWRSASAAVIIMGDGDLSTYWLEAGRAYLRASLTIEDAGLSQATSAAIVEAMNYHDDIETALGSQQRILAMIRIGRGRARRHYSPRLTTAELLH